jgi:hypothetical protein
MTPELTRRCASFLFLALALATAFGLMSLPAFDWLEPITRLSGELAWLTFSLHATLTWLCISLVTRQLARHVHPAWQSSAARGAALVLLGLALGWWLLTHYRLDNADGRGLLWLQTLVLLLWPAGLLSGTARPARSNRGGDIDDAELSQYCWHDTGAMKEVEVGRGGHMASPRARQHRALGRKHDVIRVAEDAEEALAA